MTESILATMQFHMEQLVRRCRVCGRGGMYSRKKPNALLNNKYADIIKQFYNYDIASDAKEIHPNKICDSCGGKLRRSKSVKKLNLPELAEFFPHSSDCKVCFGKAKFPDQRKQKATTNREDSVAQVTTTGAIKIEPGLTDEMGTSSMLETAAHEATMNRKGTVTQVANIIKIIPAWAKSSLSTHEAGAQLQVASTSMEETRNREDTGAQIVTTKAIMREPGLSASTSLLTTFETDAQVANISGAAQIAISNRPEDSVAQIATRAIKIERGLTYGTSSLSTFETNAQANKSRAEQVTQVAISNRPEDSVTQIATRAIKIEHGLTYGTSSLSTLETNAQANKSRAEQVTQVAISNRPEDSVTQIATRAIKIEHGLTYGTSSLSSLETDAQLANISGEEQIAQVAISNRPEDSVAQIATQAIKIERGLTYATSSLSSLETVGQVASASMEETVADVANTSMEETVADVANTSTEETVAQLATTSMEESDTQMATTSRESHQHPEDPRIIPALDPNRCVAPDIAHLLQCPCCHRVPHQPTLLKCEDIACATCIYRLFCNGISTCPACCTAFEANDIKPVEGKTLSLLQALPFKCRYASKGCVEIKARKNLLEHEDICPKKYLCPTMLTGKNRPRGPYRKDPLFDVVEKNRKERTCEAHDMLKEWAKFKREDLGDTLAYLLKREWADAEDDRLGPLLMLLKDEDWTKSK